MITNQLFQQVLIEPAVNRNVNSLQIISGYVSAGMAKKHMENLQKCLAKRKSSNREMSIDLIVGMAKKDGMDKAQHRALQRLARDKPFDIDFSCCYSTIGHPIHAKTYCWLMDGRPYDAFLGSANYTLTGFVQSQIESMTNADGLLMTKFYEEMRRDTIDCLESDSNINEYVSFFEREKDIRKHEKHERSVIVSLLEKRTHETPKKSGINWGQRDKRDPNQAYISIPANVNHGGFFPERNEEFTALTDDGEALLLVRAQDQGKALETTESNALLGRYLRSRMGLESGCYVTREHLEKYGRTDITFTKIDDETYRLNFGVPKI